MKNKKAWIIGGVIVAAVVSALVFRGGQEVEVVQATRGTFTLMVEETGYVQAVDDREVQSMLAARVSEVLVEAGDQVKAGQLLMQLSSPEQEAQTSSVQTQIAQIEAERQSSRLAAEALQSDIKQAEADLARKKRLLTSGALSSSDYEQAELQHLQLLKKLQQQESISVGLGSQLASLQEMLAHLEETTRELQVEAPMTGTVMDVPVAAGQVVIPGTVLAQIGSVSSLEVKTDLLSDEVRLVKTGQRVEITAPVLGGEAINGQISTIYPRAFEKVSALGVVQRRVPVVISLDKSSILKPGYEVKAGIETVRKDNVLLLPRESIRLTGQGSYQVMLINDGRIKIAAIKAGDRNQQVVEVLDGLKEGDSVVKDGSLELKEGTRVKIR